MTATLVYGLGIAGAAVARELVARGQEVVLADDVDNPTSRKLANDLRTRFVHNPDVVEIAQLATTIDRIIPAPGITESHRLFEVARQKGKSVLSEIELAYQFESLTNSPRPMIGVTGTDGKTTTTLMATAMVNSAGLKAVAVGNTETPLIAALQTDAQVFAVECSSFRLALTEKFRTKASVWLNLAPDHLDWHVSMDSYTSAKAKIWANLLENDIAVVPHGEQVISSFAKSSKAKVVSFGLESGDYHARNGVLTSPHGQIMATSKMGRSLPHDITNALAAAAIVVESGLAGLADVAQALQSFVNSKHRIELVGQLNGVSFYDDSKATSPHAVKVALKSFESIVLIAGGKNKGLNLDELGSNPRAMRAVVAIGDAANDVRKAFDRVCQVNTASSMKQAVEQASQLAQPGDVVLLSPGCTSFDWYQNYGQRGDDFAKEVNTLITNSERLGES